MFYGNLKDSTIKDIWSNSDFKSLRDNFLKGNKDKLPNICKKLHLSKKRSMDTTLFLGKKCINLKIKIIYLSNMSKNVIDEVFSERDKRRYKSHQKGQYPVEESYNPKEKVTKYVKKIYSSPTVINLEMTEACNVKCRHCYNPWREEHAGRFNLDNKKN